MRRLLPNSTELVILVGLAVICASIVGTLDARSADLGLAVLVFPLFVVAAVMGLRRFWSVTAPAALPVPVQPDRPVAGESVEM